MIVVVDAGLGNIGSVLNMLRKFSPVFMSSEDPAEIEKADKLILPGVGSFDTGMSNLKSKGILDVLNEKVLKQGTPILGICLGMQLLTRRSEEGILQGLGWIEADTIKFKPEDAELKVPHMGWNLVHENKQNKLLENLHEESRFYFVHSYYVKCDREEDILLKTKYGFEFASAVNKNNIYGVQFHPEKSHKFGLQLLKNFIELI
jgi:imidazole glycerol-phosphate synthase subunit HisH